MAGPATEMPQTRQSTIRWPQPIELLILLLIFVSLLLAFVAVLQLLIFISSDRAYLNIRGFEPERGAISATNPIVIGFDVKNSGRHSAIIDGLAINLSEVLPSDATAAAYPPRTVILQHFLDPNEAVHGEFHPHDTSGTNSLTLPQTVINRINNGKQNLYVYGFLVYDDGYEIPHLRGPRVYRFCDFYDPRFSNGSWFKECDLPYHHFSS
jgi:hypothetical protein